MPYGHPDFGKLFPCGCQATQAQKAPKVARLGNELGELADKTFVTFDRERTDGPRGLVPTTWQGKPFSVATQRGFLRSAFDRCHAYAADPRGWLYLHGAFGAGKSHLAAALAHAVQDALWSVHFHTANRLLDTLTAALRDGQADRLLDELLSCDLLILDELAANHLAEAASDWRFGRIERIINERLDKAMVITSNVAPDDLAIVGDLRAERVADRIAGVAQIVWLPIASARRSRSEAAS